jgi:hypothetical protein
VRLVVSAAGRARVLARNKRQVHAWAEGRECPAPADLTGLVELNYNPYRGPRFTRRDTGADVEAVALAVFTSDGKCLCQIREQS